MKIFFAIWALVTLVASIWTFSAEVQNAFFAAGLVGLLAATVVTLARLIGRPRRPTA